jgi:heme O synthase-like polyprenyltransferase
MEIKDQEHPARYCMSNKEVCFGILLGIASVVGLWLFADVLLALLAG